MRSETIQILSNQFDALSQRIPNEEPVIGAFFRQIDRADELGSGMRKLMLYGKTYGGADPEMIEGDIFRMIIGVPEFGANPAEVQQIVAITHPNRQATEQVAEQVTEQVTEQVGRLLVILAGKELSSREMMASLKLRHRPTFLYDYLQSALTLQVIEMTNPESPNSPKQKYRLTEKGKNLLADGGL